jgi:phosphocarrier protein HPr
MLPTPQQAPLEEHMAQRSVVIASPVGLHARPAAAFASAASRAPVPVTIRKLSGGDPVPAASILSVLTLGAACGDEVVLEAAGDGAEEVLDALAEMLATDGAPQDAA